MDASVRHTSDRWSGECDGGAHGGPRGAPSLAAGDDRPRGAQHRRVPGRLRAGPWSFCSTGGWCSRWPSTGPEAARSPSTTSSTRPPGPSPPTTCASSSSAAWPTPRSISNPHTGWPDNVSLLYWAAIQRDGEALTRLLLEHGADPEVRFKGNGERGCTALQEACAHGRSNRDGIVQALIDHGAHYDAFSASARDDLDRLRECAREEPNVARSLGEADMTPLHWAVRAGALRCARWLLEPRGGRRRADGRGADPPAHGRPRDAVAADREGRRPERPGQEGPHAAAPGRCNGGDLEEAEILIVLGADVRVPNRRGKTPLQVARKECLFFKRG